MKHLLSKKDNLPAPLARPRLNFSDIILIKTCLQICKPDLIVELQSRIDIIIEELLRAEIEVKRQGHI